MKIALPVFLFLAVFSWTEGAVAATIQQAESVVRQVAAYLRAFGPEKTFAAVNDRGGPFNSRDVYVFIHDRTGLIRAHGGFPSYIGTNTIWATDLDGKEFVREIVSIQTSGIVSYKWLNPETRAIQPKTTFVLKVDDLLICAGIYDPVIISE
jgi:signal transduction histidine kinase